MSSLLVNINDNLLPKHEASLAVENRALRYGDGCFETIRAINGRPVHWNLHWNRLLATCSFLRLPLDGTSAEWLHRIQELLERNMLSQGARVRLQVYRSGGGKYFPEKNAADWFIETEPLTENFFAKQPQGIRLGLIEGVRVRDNVLGNYKLCAQPLQVIAAMENFENRFDNSVLLTNNSAVCESIGNNIFSLQGKVLRTPALQTGCLGGVMRRKVMELAVEAGLYVEEGEYPVERFTDADELFLTNAIQGIQWVSSFRKHRYFHKQASVLQERLNAAPDNLY